MLSKEKIAAIVEDSFKGTDRFIVDIEVTTTNVVNLYVDSDEGITINECATISRYIEKYLDRDTEDFDLRVSSPGTDRPFKLFRQYNRYVGREVELIVEEDKKLKGKLLKIEDQELELEVRATKGKGKTIEKVAFSSIREGRPVISFK